MQTLPFPGPVWGAYPEREVDNAHGRLHRLARLIGSAGAANGSRRLPRTVLRSLSVALPRFRQASASSWSDSVTHVRQRLRSRGLTPSVLGEALALVGVAVQRTIGKSPYDTQYYAAWLILQNRLAEMATGEGKTLAAALAAAVAAMGDVPIHVMTANDYLVARDCESLRPLYAALGLTVGRVLPDMTATDRRTAYRNNITYVTAKEVAFDYLKDHLTLNGERDPRLLRLRELGGQVAAAPILSGLCMAIIDEADSILLDEACTPLILAAPAAPIDEQAFRRAFALAGELWRHRDYTVDAQARRAALTEAGTTRVTAAVSGESGALALPRRAHELVELALAARHVYRRDRDYARTAKGIEIIDGVTGRIASGRRWSNGLHQMIEIKEDAPASDLVKTVASITYQRFFPRYLRLGGMSGTLQEARRELAYGYGPVATVPPATPSKRRWLGQRMFATERDKWVAVAARISTFVAIGRPVLVGTESVAHSQHLSAALTAVGLAHEVLNAVQDADEANRIARAGVRGSVTVATNIAGRGTDITLGAGVVALGGLHVLACMRNRARRIDRQLIGRAARHGDPGSAEVLISLEDSLIVEFWPAPLLRFVRSLSPRGVVPTLVAWLLVAVAQRACEWKDTLVRRHLRRTDDQTRDLYAIAGGVE
ncbi:MAG: hypothetical protein ACKVQT_06990 [Burkholderiales bacterium]